MRTYKNMIYLNNAATSYPKPEGVIQAAAGSIAAMPLEEGRGNVKPENSDSVWADTKILAKHLMAGLIGSDDDEIYFTSGATESANLVISGLDMKKAHVIVTAAEHNCILRPLYNHPDRPDISVAPCDKNGAVSLEAVKKLIRKDTKYLFVNHMSNVTGCIQPMEMLGEMASEHGLLLIADGSQSAGCCPVDVRRMKIDIFIFTCHKNLFGTAGLGGFFMKKGTKLKAVKTGGTGYDSRRLILPDDYDEFEPGTPNYPGIAALCAGLRYIRGIGEEKIYERLLRRRCKFVQKLTALRNIEVYGADGENEYGPVISFNLRGLAAEDVGDILAENYHIAVRTGYHCSPLIHRFLNHDSGTVRLSFSYLTKETELWAAYDAVQKISEML